MGDRDKEQLVNELMKLRTKIAELENIKASKNLPVYLKVAPKP